MTLNVHTTTDPRAALASLAAVFFGPGISEEPDLLAEKELPEPYKQLLAHDSHMTTSLEAYHGFPVLLEVLEERENPDQYHRKILLTSGPGRHVVEVGVVRINLAYTSTDVRNEIVAKKAPLGDILIRHNVLRDIEPKWFFRFKGPPALKGAFDRALPEPIYGRVGVIHCDGEPAIELLEVIASDKAVETSF